MGILMGPGQFNFDMSVLKTTRITESKTLQFRLEFFNLLNHPQFNSMGLSAGTSFGASIPQPLTQGSGTISTASVNPRIIQLGLKFIF
jgi:hypothetical protein